MMNSVKRRGGHRVTAVHRRILIGIGVIALFALTAALTVVALNTAFPAP
jgi:hypothetical protein